VKEKERETEEKVRRAVRYTTFNGEGEQRLNYGYEGSQAVPARPSGKGRLKRR
jgi:hypothetical protein